MHHIRPQLHFVIPMSSESTSTKSITSRGMDVVRPSHIMLLCRSISQDDLGIFHICNITKQPNKNNTRFSHATNHR